MYKITPAGSESVIWDFGLAGTERQPVMDTSGNLYGTTLDGPNINGTVYKLTKNK